MSLLVPAQSVEAWKYARRVGHWLGSVYKLPHRACRETRRREGLTCRQCQEFKYIVRLTIENARTAVLETRSVFLIFLGVLGTCSAGCW